jgi:glycosyltransferase involved in cell wall biosynthesis
MDGYYQRQPSEPRPMKESRIENLFCFSHLRWNFVYQRPQHLMSRFANVTRVFFVEEPIYEGTEASLDINVHLPKVTVITPKLPVGCCHGAEANNYVHQLLKQYMITHNIEPCVFWYYSPMALNFTRSFQSLVTVYDCMDELTGFLFAPPDLVALEGELFGLADAVFTGGNSLYEAKKNRHANIHAFPSSIDQSHFAKARVRTEEPLDQSRIPAPRIGFYGVLDERLNLELVAKMAEQKPDWNFIFIGPVVKIDPSTLPKRNNIHYLGGKSYDQLPAYLSGWDVAMMPFAKNASTRYISPTKTPEYLAGGKPVVSTSIADVVNDYGNAGLVAIADTAEDFVARIEEILSRPTDPKWLRAVDNHLAGISWDKTWARMNNIIVQAIEKKIDSQTKMEGTNV